MPSPISRATLLFGAALATLAPCAAAQAWTETVLYAFKGGTDGVYPQSTLIMDAQGNLYGTTEWGGGYCGGHNCGTVFKVTPNGQETVLHAFDLKDGKWPTGGLVMDAAGNLYGTTSEGGGGAGSVFKITPAGVHTILHAFGSSGDGREPFAGLAIDGAGSLYGTTAFDDVESCSDACGTVFKITPAGNYSTIYAFKGGRDGESPRSTPVFGLAGNLYGTTEFGGTTKCGDSMGCGTIFRIASNGSESVIRGREYTATGDLVADAAGNVYGVTYALGGTGCGGNGCGTIFKIAPDETETILATFNRTGNLVHPQSIATDGNGTFYGVAAVSGGTQDCGMIFKFVPGHKPRAIYSFTCKNEGAGPEAGLLVGKDGTLYGTTVGGGVGFGTVFAIRK